MAGIAQNHSGKNFVFLDFANNFSAFFIMLEFRLFLKMGLPAFFIAACLTFFFALSVFFDAIKDSFAYVQYTSHRLNFFDFVSSGTVI